MDSQNYDVANAYFQRGLDKAELGRYEDAIADWDEVIRLAPDFAAAYGNRGWAKLALERNREAITDCDEAIRLGANFAWIYNNRGAAKANLGRYDEAIADYDEATKVDPNFPLAYSNRGWAKSNLERFQEAIADCDEAIKLDPNLAFAYGYRGSANFGLERFQEAIADCDEAIKLNPNLALAYGILGGAKASLERFQEAIADCDEAVKLDPNLALAYGSRGLANFGLERFQEAIADCNEAIRLAPNFALAYNIRGWAKARLERLQDAIADYDEAIRLDPGLAFAYNKRSEAKEMLGRYREASEDREQSFRLQTGSSGTSQSSATSSMIERPNQEALTKALNAYRDVMRRFILDNLLQSYGANRLMDAITTALGDDQVANFERDLSRNGGNVEATLDVNHISSVARHHWDEIFFAKFGYDQTMLGTLGWVTRARNDAAHPGTADISPEDTNDHFNNIIKVLDRIGAVEEVRVVEEVRKQLNAPSQDALTGSYSTQTAIAHSICANIRCQIVNQYQHPINWDGVASVQCPKCLKQYFVQTCTVVSDDRQNTHTAITHALRVRFPNGEDRIMEFYHSLQIPMERKDKLTISYDRDENLVYLVNENLRQWWYFPIGIKPKRPWWRTTSGPHYTGCYSALSRIIANSFYDPRANFWDRFMNRPFAHVLMAVSGHSKIPLTGMIGQ